MQETQIHPTAIVDPGAELGQGVTVGPYSVIGPKVRIGDRTELKSHCIIQGRTTLGQENQIWPFASLGTQPQDLKYKGEDCELIVGDRNMFREYSNVSIGTVTGISKTMIGSENLLMVCSHVAHDCIIGDNCVIANGVSLGGHVEVGSRVILGGHSAVHQHCHVGDHAMVAAGAIAVQDVPPYCTVAGNHASTKGLNLVGLQRAKFGKEKIDTIKEMYRLLYRSGLTLDKAINEISALNHPELTEDFINFLRNASRGVCR